MCASRLQSGSLVIVCGSLHPAVHPRSAQDYAMSRLEIHQFMCLTDHFAVLLREPHSNTVAAVDAPETAPIMAALEAKGWELTHILTTHHHRDHTDGNLDLKSMSGCTIFGPRGEADKVRG